PDVIIANSREVAGRVRRLWRRRAEVINPPVDVAGMPLSAMDDGYLLVVARLLAYRRVDLAVRACTALAARLVVVGDGPERDRLERMAGPTVEFVQPVSRERLVDLYARCHAYLVPGIEDFGMAPIEAMAAGKPVVAFAAGGALETVVEGVTGTFFERDDPGALATAIRRLESLPLDSARIRAHAERFDAALFRARMRALFRRLGVDSALYSAD
ncbi:MAG: glycosyltransferase, partial [Chloroflexota bacterium]|nr:glycosyltransferase [Chloroflexota bacterium]